jgi:WhiB family redox-sensing transcriptional regulator
MSGRCGTYTSYTRGCRCDDCRAAGTEYQRAYQQRKREERDAGRDPYEPAGIDEGDTSWMERGACRSAGPQLFFPTRGSNGGNQAKTICQACPVTDECLDYALRTGQRYGIWGGMNYDERTQVQRKAKVCGDCGIDIGDRARNATYCQDCSAVRAREAHRQANSRYYHSYKWEDRQVAS